MADQQRNEPVTVTQYKWAGKLGPLRIKTNCDECDLTTATLEDMMNNEFEGKNVTFEVKPWLDNLFYCLARACWHAPIIMMGYNYPGQPILGVLLMTLYTIALAFFLGYVMLKSGSVWLVAYLHGLNNAIASFLMVMVYRPDDAAMSFPLGFYSLFVWALVVAGLLIVGRKEWMAPAEAEGEPISVDEASPHAGSGG